MLRIKKLDIFILKSFCTLFMGTFFICLFIFMMQFLWKYVDEMVGKGLEMSVLAQFFFYSALTLVPASLPLAILLAALITFGNFGERFELLAMKAAGISLLKIMRPLIVFIIFICGVSFYFQNVIGPKAQTKLWTLLISMKQKSPELDIPEGVFYDEIDGYNLYVKHKNRKTGMLYDVLIYNFEKGFENAQIIKSDSGRLEMTADKQHLYLHLYNGEQFENLKSQNMNQKNVPRKRGKGGRPPKDDPAFRRLTVNLTGQQHAAFLSMYEQSGLASLSAFIAARIFGDEFRVVKTDATALEFVTKLTAFYGQIRAIGTNYNQVVKQLHTVFGEKKALSLLYKLEQQTIELAGIGRLVLALCEDFKAKIG